MTYTPNSIDTSRVDLPKELRRLIEKLAENNHDLWAQKRIAEGWTYGPERDDRKRTHPDLLPYSDLPESEKEYDRITATEVLKVITALGYKIYSPPKRLSGSSLFAPKPLREVLKRIKTSESFDLESVLMMWKSISSVGLVSSPKIYEMLGNRILKVGEPLVAYDIISEGLKHWPRNVRLRQLLGLALARSGATERANEALSKLHEEGNIDGETLGILARTHKDLSTMATNRKEKQKHLAKAVDNYYEGYQRANTVKKRGWMDDAIYNGINAASTILLMGQKSQARALAREVREVCLRKLKRKRDNYWALATLGEAGIIFGDWKEARENYLKAAELGKDNYGDLSATRHQARILLEYLGEDKHRFDHCFRIPSVVIFGGHMEDQPGRPRPRFPHYLQEKIRTEISGRLKKLNAGFGYASASCGSDILFLEEMLKRKNEINVVLPLPPEKFRQASVDIIPGADWGKRFQSVLKRATRTVIASEHRSSGNAVAYEYASQLQHGLAVLRAKTLDTEVVILAVWDGQPGNGPWGTASFVEHWRSQGLEPELIHLENLIKGSAAIRKSPVPAVPTHPMDPVVTAPHPEFPQEIKAILFADVVGYGKLIDEQVPVFVERFMGLVANLGNTSLHKPLTRNTWGDALYFVFASVEDAGSFALQLRDRICGIDWKEKGLPEDLNLRISLHAGPVYYCEDPVIDRLKYTGSHVSRAARIEPVTPPGEVYASQAFAALAVAQRVRGFALDYVGQVPLPKEDSISPLYLVRRRTR